MRIVFLFNSATIIGGGEIGFLELIRRAVAEPDIEPWVWAPGPGEVSARLDAAGIPWQPIALPGLRGPGLFQWPWRSWRTMARPWRAGGVDLVHANGARCMLYAGTAGRLAHIPTLWHVRVLERDPVLDRLRARLAARIVCNSRAVADSLSFAPGAAGKTVVVYNGVEQSRFRTAIPADVHAEFGIPRERRVVLCAALLVEWKGQQDLIEALAHLPAETRAGLQVVFAGRELTPGAPFTRRLRQRAAALGVAGNLTWAGHRDDLPRLMRGCDLLALPSHGEPFGRVIVEAWAAGLPVLACNAGGAAEIVSHGKTGWLVPPASPPELAAGLQTLLADSALRRRLARAGRAHAEDFTLEKHAAALFALYRSITAKRPGRAGEKARSESR